MRRGCLSRFGLVRGRHLLEARHEEGRKAEWRHTGEAGHEAAKEVRQQSEADAIFEPILEAVETPGAVLEAILKTVETPEAVLETILKTIRTSWHKARIDYRASKSGREPMMEASLHPVGHSASGTLGVSLAGTS